MCAVKEALVDLLNNPRHQGWCLWNPLYAYKHGLHLLYITVYDAATQQAPKLHDPSAPVSKGKCSLQATARALSIEGLDLVPAYTLT